MARVLESVGHWSHYSKSPQRYENKQKAFLTEIVPNFQVTASEEEVCMTWIIEDTRILAILSPLNINIRNFLYLFAESLTPEFESYAFCEAESLRDD